MTITDAQVEAQAEIAKLLERVKQATGPDHNLSRDVERLMDEAATQLSNLSAEVAALRSERANLIATKREQIDRIEDRATRAEEQLKAAREAMTRISDIKYPTVDTHYALKATIDYARDQSRLALSNHEVGK